MTSATPMMSVSRVWGGSRNVSLKTRTTALLKNDSTSQPASRSLSFFSFFDARKSDVQTATKSDIKQESTPEANIEKSLKQPKKKTMAEIDEELRLKMEGRAGDGGEAGMELEDGKPVAMKKSVRDNMFRYI